MARILVVDDDAALRELLSEFLSDAGHCVDTAESGLECLSKLRAGSFQLVTLDVDMPKLGGMETLKLIRKEPRLAKVPVLMCTAKGMLGEVDQAYEDGATGYIVKPFDLSALARKVEGALAGK